MVIFNSPLSSLSLSPSLSVRAMSRTFQSSGLSADVREKAAQRRASRRNSREQHGAAGAPLPPRLRGILFHVNLGNSEGGSENDRALAHFSQQQGGLARHPIVAFSLFSLLFSHQKKATMPPAAGPPPTAAVLITMLEKMRSEDKVRKEKKREREKEAKRR